MNEPLFKETIIELVKESFGDLMKHIYTFDESKNLQDTIIPPKVKTRVYKNVLIKTTLGKGVGVVYLC